MPDRSPPASAALDEISPVRPIQHLFRLMVRQNPRTVGQVLGEALDAGATLEGLTAAQYPGGHEVSLRLTGIDSPAARRLAERFGGLSDVAFAQVEHFWSART